MNSSLDASPRFHLWRFVKPTDPEDVKKQIFENLGGLYDMQPPGGLDTYDEIAREMAENIRRVHQGLPPVSNRPVPAGPLGRMTMHVDNFEHQCGTEALMHMLREFVSQRPPPRPETKSLGASRQSWPLGVSTAFQQSLPS